MMYCYCMMLWQNKIIMVNLLILFCVHIPSADVCINERQFFLHGPTSELLVCNLKLTANVSSSMKQLAEQEWGNHSSLITVTHGDKR